MKENYSLRRTLMTVYRKQETPVLQASLQQHREELTKAFLDDDEVKKNIFKTHISIIKVLLEGR